MRLEKTALKRGTQEFAISINSATTRSVSVPAIHILYDLVFIALMSAEFYLDDELSKNLSYETCKTTLCDNKVNNTASVFAG